MPEVYTRQESGRIGGTTLLLETRWVKLVGGNQPDDVDGQIHQCTTLKRVIILIHQCYIEVVCVA